MKSITITSTAGSFTFNQSVNGTTMTNFEGFEYPDNVNVIQPLGGRDGAYFVGNKLTQRIISWQGELTEDNVLLQRRNLIKAMKPGELLTIDLVTYDNLELRTFGSIRNFTVPYSRAYSKYLVEFTCPDYRFLSQELYTNSTQPTVTTGGTAIPTAIPLSLVTTSGTSLLSVTNNGTIDALPEVIIRGAGTNFTVQNQTTGDSFTLNTTLTTTETVTVNFLNKTVTKSNGQNLYGQFSGSLKIASGLNKMYFNANSGSDGNTLLTINYRDSYGGL